MYWDDVETHIGKEQLEAFWMSHPAVRACLNGRITGNPHQWPLDWFKIRLASRLPFSDSLSVGCGTGSLEREVVKIGITRRVLGIDVAEHPLEYARTKAEEEGLTGIEYRCADAWNVLDGGRRFDSVFVHAALHHFDRPADLLGRIREVLNPGGILYIDDYIGPSMKDWTWRGLLLPNLVYYLLPRKLRRPGLVRTPVNPRDPTEAVASGEILSGLYRHFQILERRDYGGQLLSLLYPNLARPGNAPGAPTTEAFDRAVDFILRLEDRLLAHPRWPGSRSFHTVVIAQ